MIAALRGDANHFGVISRVGKNITLETLIDSGSTHQNFISQQAAKSLPSRIYPRIDDPIEGTYGDGRTWKAAQAINVTMIIDPTSLGEPEREIVIKLHILKDLCVDVILGVPAIHEYYLWPILMAQVAFNAKNGVREVVAAMQPADETLEGMGPTEEIFPTDADFMVDSQENKAKILDDVTIGAHPELDGLKSLILEFVDSFRDKVDPKQPAKLPPYKIKLDKVSGSFHFPRAMKLGPRRQCNEHNEEIARQVGTLAEREVIETSSAEFYS